MTTGQHIAISALYSVSLCVLAWLVYPSLLEFVLGSMPLMSIATSPEEALAHQAQTTLSFGLLGGTISLGAWLCMRLSSASATRAWFTLTLSGAAGALFQGLRVNEHASLLKTSNNALVEPIAIQATQLPLYELAGAGAGAACVALVTMTVIALHRRR